MTQLCVHQNLKLINLVFTSVQFWYCTDFVPTCCLLMKISRIVRVLVLNNQKVLKYTINIQWCIFIILNWSHNIVVSQFQLNQFILFFIYSPFNETKSMICDSQYFLLSIPVYLRKKHFKDDTASLPVACCCTSRHLFSVHEDDQLIDTWNVGFNIFFIDPLLIWLGRGFMGTNWRNRAL